MAMSTHFVVRKTYLHTSGLPLRVGCHYPCYVNSPFTSEVNVRIKWNKEFQALGTRPGTTNWTLVADVVFTTWTMLDYATCIWLMSQVLTLSCLKNINKMIRRQVGVLAWNLEERSEFEKSICLSWVYVWINAQL